MRPFWLILLLPLLSSCSGYTKYFEEPMSPDDCWMCFDQGSWTVEDIHVHVNRVVADKYYKVKRPSFNGTCLEAAELKYEMALSEGYRPEIVIVRLHKEVENLRRASSPLHAVLVVDGTVYDNGFISAGPFDRGEIALYGTEIPDVWSDYRTIK